MSKLSDEKLLFLKGDYSKFVWYITKQNTNFRDLTIMASILEMWNDNPFESFQSFFDKKKVTDPYKYFIKDTPHRALRNCEYYGLMKPTAPNSKAAYSSNNLTEIYYQIKNICNNNFSDTEKYQHIIDKQIENMSIKVNNKEISPIFFTLKVLLTIGDVTGAYRVSVKEFKLFVSNSNEWNQYFQSVESILRYRSDAVFKNESEKNYSIANETRFNLVFDNLSYIKTEGKNIEIKEDKLELVRRKVAEYELGSSIDNNNDPKIKINLSEVVKENYQSIISALRTKPFLLLAGISGTGKSRKVQELAYLTCKRDGNLDQDETSPGNYLLIPVKPNWHDSTELLGYYSSISGKYILTDFIRFVWKAWLHRDTSFFICLDEMNLAPVEQYFAEYLSVIETRKRVKDEVTGEYYIQTAELLPKKTFESLDVKEHVVSAKPEGGYVIDDSMKIKNAYKGDDYQIMLFLKENGLRIPDNLFVIGTVNMDDTTHQFSRKVIDRAFTIEMNGGNLKDMFVEHDTLSYQQEPLALDAIKPRFVKAADVLEFYKEDAEIIKEEVPNLLEYINGVEIFKDTPFRVSYRVQNELIIYYAAIRPEGSLPEEEVKKYLNQAFMAVLLEKVLPRVEGDEKTMRCDEKNDSKILMNLKSYLENNFKPAEQSVDTTIEGDGVENDEKKNTNQTDSKASIYNLIIGKLDEMNKRVKDSYFTSFFS